MKLRRIATLLLTLALTLSVGLQGSAQSAWEQIDQALKNSEESYSRAYTLSDPATSTPESGSTPAMASVILVMGDEEEAQGLYNLFIEMSEEDDYTIESMDGLGDESVFIIEPSPGGAENIMMVRQSDIVVIAVASQDGPDMDVQETLVRQILETGPSDEEFVVDDEGVVSGGWADAFPEPEDVAGLESYTASPVIVFGLIQPATAIPVSPVEVSTPAS